MVFSVVWGIQSTMVFSVVWGTVVGTLSATDTDTAADALTFTTTR
jgi:hypothetical protein